MKLSRRPLRYVRLAVRTVLLVLFAVALGYGVSSDNVFASWQEPTMITPLNDGDPNADNPLYAGSDASYGGMAQFRVGALTIGSSASAGSETLSVVGRTLIKNQLRMGTGDFSTGNAAQSAIAAFAGANHGVYGTTANASKAGVLGTTSVAGKGVWGNAAGAIDGVGVYGLAQGNGSFGVLGVNPGAGDAGYFSGKVLVRGIAGGSSGTLDVTHGGSFTGNMSVLGGMVSTANLTLTGVPFDPRTVIARSIQDAASANPAGDPGVRSFVLNSSGLPCKISGVACTGAVAAGSTAEWNLGPTFFNGTGFINDRKVVQTYLAQYSYDGRVFEAFTPATATDVKYDECTSNGMTPLGKFSITNSLGAPAQFRLIVLYKEFNQSITCNPTTHIRQITIPVSYQGDSIQIKLDGTTTPTAAEVFDGTSSPTGDDMRVRYNGSDIDRDIVSFTNANVEIWFRVQADIAAPDSTSYTLYYGDSTVTMPPPANRDNVYLLVDNFNDNSLDGNKWLTTYLNGPWGGSCVPLPQWSFIEETNQQLRIHHLRNANCASGAGAFSRNAYDVKGKYTLTFSLSPEQSDTQFGSGMGNDGVYLRNPTVNRGIYYWGGPTEMAIYTSLGDTCSWSQGIEGFSRGANVGEGCPWNADYAHRYAGYGYGGYYGYPFTYTDNSVVPYPFKIELETDTRAYRVFEPATVSPAKITGTINAADFTSIGPTFVVEMFDGYSGSTEGIEAYDDFLLRRGRDSLTPQGILGPEM